MAIALVNPYTDLDSVKMVLKFSLTDATKDEELKKAINDASRYIDRYLGKDFFFHDFTTTGITLDESADVQTTQLFLPYSPILTITSITSAGTALVLSTDYTIVRLANGIEFIRSLGANWKPVSPDALLVVKGTFGYVQATSADVPTGLPGHISWAAAQIAAAFSGHNRKEVTGLDGQKQDILSNSIPKTVYEVLGKKPQFEAMV